VRWPRYQRLIKAEPTLLFFRGEFLEDAMRRQRVTEAEVLAAMRQQGFGQPSEVDAVVFETEGSLSVLKDHAGSAEALKRLGVSTRHRSGRRLAADRYDGREPGDDSS
jgi:uncharacterized membrane protein YcaP (DUF421 family)